MKKILAVFLAIFLSFFVFSVRTASAVDPNFTSTLKTVYTVSTDGSTFVQHTFRIENLTPTYYISRHGLRISSPNVSGIKVTEGQEELNAETTTVGNQTNIGITFPDKLVGEGKAREFTISYRSQDIAQVNGKVLEVTIPKQADPDQYDSYSVTLNTPFQFGNPSRVTPIDDFSIESNDSFIKLGFDNLGGEGVSAIYGIEQIFNLDFRYFLENNDSQPVLLQVSMPPDTNFQRMHYENIEPLPEEIIQDQDGNWIATFFMDGNTAQTVEVSAKALLTLDPSQLVPVPQPQPFHTRPQNFWEVNSGTIRSLAKEHQTPKAIYDFVTSSLTYGDIDSVDDIERVGALKTLENPEQALCQEFTDLFVTLSRANNIPTRAITGYAYTENSQLRPLSLVEDILHAWPEYWDAEKQLWLPTDPTWGNTTGGVDYFNQFDLNHIVLAINGESSTLPYPAGAYKTQEHREKSLEVSFGTLFPVVSPEIQASLEKRQGTRLGTPGFYSLRLHNPTGQAWYNISFEILSTKSGITVQADQNTFSSLLPFQTAEIPLFIYNTDGWLPESDSLAITVSVDGQEVTNSNVKITSAPRFFQLISHPQAPLFVGGALIFVTLISGSVLVLRQKR